MEYWRQSTKNIYVAAHRGWSAKYPENTMEAYKAAVALDVDQIENDIRITKDGELVLIHDATVDRTTDGTGRVCDFTFEELQSLDAGVKKGEEFKGAKIPKLVDFMELVAPLPKMTVDFELKEYPTEGHEEVSFNVCDRVMKMIDDYDMMGRCVINTFSAKLHAYIREKYGDRVKRHVYFPMSCMSNTEYDSYTGAYCICMFGDGAIMADKEEFDKKWAEGIRPWAGAGVKDAEGVDMAISHGAELITCNNPDEILRLLRERGYHD